MHIKNIYLRATKVDDPKDNGGRSVCHSGMHVAKTPCRLTLLAAAIAAPCAAHMYAESLYLYRKYA